MQNEMNALRENNKIVFLPKSKTAVACYLTITIKPDINGKEQCAFCKEGHFQINGIDYGQTW